MIYLDNAATTLFKPESVYKKSDEALRLFSANPGRSGHSQSILAGEKLFNARTTIADFFNSSPSCVIFTFGCTDSLNLVLRGTLNTGDHVIHTVYDHNSVLRPLEFLKTRGITATTVLPDKDGKIYVSSLKEALQKNTKAVIINHISNVTGIKQNIEEIGYFCKKNNVLFIVDAAQSAGNTKIDVKMQNIDYLCCPCHKGLLGPQGLGLLILGKNSPSPTPLRFGGTGTRSFDLSQPSELPEFLESGTLSVQNILSCEAGVKFVADKINEINKKETMLISRLSEGLARIPQIETYSHKKIESGVFAFNIKNTDSIAVSEYLDKNFGIALRGGFHCAPLVHKFLNTDSSGALRASVSYFNTISDIDFLIFAIKETIKIHY